MTAAEIDALRAAGAVALDVDGEPAELGPAEVEVVQSSVPPYIAAAENGLTVAIDTTLTDDLVDEGLAREIINRVQNLRKKSGLEVTDRIVLAVGGAPRLARVLAAHGQRIADETLADLVEEGAAWPRRDQFRVDDVDIVVSLARKPSETGG